MTELIESELTLARWANQLDKLADHVLEAYSQMKLRDIDEVLAIQTEMKYIANGLRVEDHIRRSNRPEA